MNRARAHSWRPAVAALALLSLAGSACSKSEQAAGAGGDESAAADPATPTPSGVVPASTGSTEPAAATPATGTPGGQQAEPALDPAQIPAVVARLDGAEITKQDLLARAGEAQSTLAKRGGGGVKPTKAFFRKVLDDIVGNRLLFRDLSGQGKGATPAEVDQKLASIRGQFPSEEAFDQSLAARGFDRERLKRDIAEGITVSRWITQTVAPSISVQETELKKFYDDNLEKMIEPEKVRGRHILVKVDQKAPPEERAAKRKSIDALRAKLTAGGDFATLARESSDDKQSGAQGGELGWFFKGQMVPAFENVAFALPIGKVSDVVETRFGYHLIEVHEKQPEKKVPFESAKGRIEQLIKQHRLEETVKARINELAGKTKIEILI